METSGLCGRKDPDGPPSYFLFSRKPNRNRDVRYELLQVTVISFVANPLLPTDNPSTPFRCCYLLVRLLPFPSAASRMIDV
jgi:hypothetical protein